MLKHILLGLGAASLLVVVTAMPAHSAGLLLGQEPRTSVIVNAGGAEWVWASPCGALQPSCDDARQSGGGDLPLHSRFTLPTPTQWNASFLSLSALEQAFTTMDTAGIVTTICAAEYFTRDPMNNHCDLGDLRIGNIWDSPLTDPLLRSQGISDTFLWRAVAAPVVPPVYGAVPEPSSLLLLGAGLLGLAVWRWKHTA